MQMSQIRLVEIYPTSVVGTAYVCHLCGISGGDVYQGYPSDSLEWYIPGIIRISIPGYTLTEPILHPWDMSWYEFGCLTHFHPLEDCVKAQFGTWNCCLPDLFRAMVEICWIDIISSVDLHRILTLHSFPATRLQVRAVSDGSHPPDNRSEPRENVLAPEPRPSDVRARRALEGDLWSYVRLARQQDQWLPRFEGTLWAKRVWIHTLEVAHENSTYLRIQNPPSRGVDRRFHPIVRGWTAFPCLFVSI